MQYPKLVKSIERNGVSDRIAADMLSSILYDLGYITEDNYYHIVDRSKIRRMRKKYRETIVNECFDEVGSSIFFDGKKDNTRQKDGTMKVEEHITLLSEPGENYLGHCIPNGNSNADNITTCILSKLEQYPEIEVKV